MIAHWIYKEKQTGKSLEKAIFACEDFFEKQIEAHGELYGYTGPLGSKRLEGIYSEALLDIRQIYRDV